MSLTIRSRIFLAKASCCVELVALGGYERVAVLAYMHLLRYSDLFLRWTSPTCGRRGIATLIRSRSCWMCQAGAIGNPIARQVDVQSPLVVPFRIQVSVSVSGRRPNLPIIKSILGNDTSTEWKI